MPLKLRSTGLGHGVYKDTIDYGVFCGEWCIGRIYETRTGPQEASSAATGAWSASMRPAPAPKSLRWFWALCAPQAMDPTHRRTRGDAGPGQGRIRGELEAMEGVGGDRGSWFSHRTGFLSSDRLAGCFIG